tara:strand:- start:14295 stop:15638 length:1344 start_codon:yes stop_codon:yes gene_type:complete
MNLSPTAQATLLLTCYFSKASSEKAKPLTNTEWGRFALWLKEKNITPADLLALEPKPLLDGWHDSRIDVERILQLLNRGHSLALAVEKWQRAGLWVVTRSDAEYPRRLKQRLKTDSPPVLFGCGNKALLNSGGLAVIGSRNANESDLSFTQQVGAKAAAEGISIVSGGARGVDETAMLGAMNSGGSVIGIMADSLLKAATSAKWRKGIMNNTVVLVSPFYPEAGFNAGNAMARNKYIYCLADSALVIHSGKKGGTISGAEENLKKHWVPLWVKPTEDKDAANANLVSKGGHWCAGTIEDLSVVDLCAANNSVITKMKDEQSDMFALADNNPVDIQTELLAPNTESNESQPLKVEEAPEDQAPEDQASIEPEAVSNKQAKLNASTVDFYQIFISELHSLTTKPLTLDEIMEFTELNKSQLNDWLKRAVDEGSVQKLSRPIRYQYVEKK